MWVNGQWVVLQDEASSGEGNDTSTGGSAPEPAAPAPKPEVDIAAGMLDAISKGVSTEGGNDDSAGEADKTGDETGEGAGAKPAAPAGDDTAAGGADGGRAAVKKPAEEASQKKADDFLPTDDEKKALAPKTVGRLHELHRFAKEQETRVAELTETNTQLAEARGNIMKVFADSKIEPDDLVAFADFNYQLKSGDYKGALAKVEEYRTMILSALGEAAPGYDPIDEHADLKARVDKLELSREDAIELVKARNLRKVQETQGRQQQEEQQSTQQAQRAQDQALAAVSAWEAALKTDPAYAAKREKIGPLVADVIKKYPPGQWVQTLDLMYRNIVASAPAPRQQQDTRQPLRASGVKPGAPAPSNMEDAISIGLGYGPKQ